MLVYMDDLIVLSKDENEGLRNLKTVLTTVSRTGLFINWKKYHFLQRRVEFLGHIVESGTIRPSEPKLGPLGVSQSREMLSRYS